ncbi:hypothetical protein ACFTUH_35510, partial [Streptomyces coelicoflavus]
MTMTPTPADTSTAARVDAMPRTTVRAAAANGPEAESEAATPPAEAIRRPTPAHSPAVSAPPAGVCEPGVWEGLVTSALLGTDRRTPPGGERGHG